MIKTGKHALKYLYTVQTSKNSSLLSAEYVSVTLNPIMQRKVNRP